MRVAEVVKMCTEVREGGGVSSVSRHFNYNNFLSPADAADCRLLAQGTRHKRSREAWRMSDFVDLPLDPSPTLNSYPYLYVGSYI